MRRTAAAVALALLLALAPPAGAIVDGEVDARRVAGADRYGTAAAIARQRFADGAGSVVVASGASFPDALTAGWLAAALDAPLLLTAQDSIPSATADVLDALAPEEIVVVGGSAAVSPAVEAALEEVAPVDRIAGADRYDTAVRVARRAGPDADADTAVVASGETYADLLAAATVVRSASPVVLVERDRVPDGVVDVLVDRGVDRLLVLGGVSTISGDVRAELEDATGATAERLAGADRYETAVAIARWHVARSDVPVEEVVLVNGNAFPDGLAAATYVRSPATIVVTVDGRSLAPSTVDLVDEHSPTITTVTAIGGTAAVTDRCLAEAKGVAEALS